MDHLILGRGYLFDGRPRNFIGTDTFSPCRLAWLFIWIFTLYIVAKGPLSIACILFLNFMVVQHYFLHRLWKPGYFFLIKRWYPNPPRIKWRLPIKSLESIYLQIWVLCAANSSTTIYFACHKQLAHPETF